MKTTLVVSILISLSFVTAAFGITQDEFEIKQKSYKDAYEGALNQIAKSELFNEVNRWSVQNISKVDNWTGELTTISTPKGGGDAYVIIVSKKNKIKVSYKANISGDLYYLLSAMPLNTYVKFSGSFAKKKGLLKESSFTEGGRMRAPEFVMKLTNVIRNNEYYEEMTTKQEEEKIEKRKEKLKKIIRKAEKEVSKNTRLAIPRNALGNAYKNAELYDKAIAQYKLAFELKPNYATPVKNLGAVYVMLENYSEGVVWLTKSLNIKGKRKLNKAQKEESYYYLGVAYYNMSEIGKARDSLVMCKDEYYVAASKYLDIIRSEINK